MTTNNKNNASQTLFRFVSLRNPQLTETKADNLGFIHRPKGLTSFFDNNVPENESAIAKFRAMESASEAFNATGFENEAQIESGVFVEALKLGRKISKREVLSDPDRDSAIAIYNSITQDQYKLLWDNIMFQTVRQSDFYVKEAIVHILKAIHYGYACQLQPTDELKKINGEDLKAKSLEAKVVLPLRFFGDGKDHTNSPTTNKSFTVGESAIGSEDPINVQLPIGIQEQLKAEGEKISELSGLGLGKQGLETLKEELEKIQKSYYKIKNKAYEAAYKEYSEAYQPQIDEYNRKLEEIEARIEAGATEEEIRAMYEELGELNVPQFIFNYKAELNFGDFKAKLSLDSLKLFVNIFTDAGERELDFSVIDVISDRSLQVGENIINIDQEYDTYAEVFEELAERLNIQTQSLFEKTTLNEKVYANLGGVLVPISNNPSNSLNNISRTYYLRANQSNGTSSYATFYYQAESNAWGTATAKVYAITSVGEYTENYSNISVANNKVTFPAILVNKYQKDIRLLRIQIFFNNGEEANLEFSGIQLETPYTGVLYTERTKDPIGGGSTPKPGTFIPKHFGVKRLGIADYLKVEQSTHAYVPGEVSNVENVMAKEFRQKSTRRLRKSEIQTTTSKSTERENLNDTTTTSRNDLQSEVANVIQQDTQAQASFRYGGGSLPFEVGGGFATNNSKETSTRQAIAKSQEITEKATERILTKVAEERIEKIIEEFEENNAHGFDNRNGDKHVVGVYRWIDKKMKNQIYNYGKRTMFEFMIPEPAKLHRLATMVTKDNIKEPVDPRKAEGIWKMPDSKSATEDQIKHWASYYGVALTELPESNILYTVETGPQNLNNSAAPRILNLMIPDNYKAYEAYLTYGFYNRFKKNSSQLTIDNLKGGFLPPFINPNREGWLRSNYTITGINIVGNYAMQYAGSNGTTDMSLIVKTKCTLSDAFMASWKKESFDNIIKAYETAYEAFLVKQKEADEKAKEGEENNKEKVSNFYREMERVIIKHNCIAYLLQDYLNVLGQKFTNGSEKDVTMASFEVYLNENLDNYTALAKFMEQAFEWTIMDYTFYPYYWANRDEWQTMYLSESTDPLFRNFLQAGMARVIVTVNPGFEDAVQFFMTTGRIWNGGEVPVIGDPMYMSIVDEMREPLGLKQGKAWITTLPTSLNILQEDSIGLKTLTALPFTEENPDEFEVPSDVVTNNSDFEQNKNLLGGAIDTSEDKVITGDWV